jgi:4-hydroxythreonine-4-phosphate dehydrogenase
MTGRAGQRAALALTRGDPAGIGPELALQAWLATHSDPDAVPFFIVAHPDHLSRLAQKLAWNVPMAIVAPLEAAATFPHALPIVALPDTVASEPGHPAASDATGTIASIETCVGLIKSGAAAAIVTNPISKEMLYRAGFPYPGHTEFLGALAARDFGKTVRPVMLLWSPELAVVPATIHVPIAQVPALMTRELLVETGRIVATDFVQRFGITAPRLAFAGLNPHAGEGGEIGREDCDIIAPALAELAALGIAVSGPYPADTLFHAAARRKYDVVIAMYHDQALIPIKTLAFESAVNVTLGLPFIRTSPDHGTAFDIAGKGIADPTSLIAALKLAGRLASSLPMAECPAR